MLKELSLQNSAEFILELLIRINFWILISKKKVLLEIFFVELR